MKQSRTACAAHLPYHLRHIAGWLALCAGLLLLPLVGQAAGELPPVKGALIVGSWSWQQFGGQCRETFQYRANGSLRVSSGESLTVWTYDISPQPGPEGFYSLIETLTESNGKTDCTGDSTGQPGDSSSHFVQFSPGHEQMIVCRQASLNACFGPLRRQP